MLISKCKNVNLKRFNDSKAFIKYLNDMQDIYKNINKYNPVKRQKVLNQGCTNVILGNWRYGCVILLARLIEHAKTLARRIKVNAHV